MGQSNQNGRYLNNNSGVEQWNQNNNNNPQFAAQPNIRIPSGASPLPSTTLLPSPISHGLPMKNLSQIFNKSLGETNATKFGNPNSSVVSNNNNNNSSNLPNDQLNFNKNAPVFVPSQFKSSGQNQNQNYEQNVATNGPDREKFRGNSNNSNSGIAGQDRRNLEQLSMASRNSG